MYRHILLKTLVLLLVSTICSCKPQPEPDNGIGTEFFTETLTMESFVFSYYKVKKIDAIQDSNSVILLRVHRNPSIIFAGKNEYAFFSEENEHNIYTSMNQRHNDISYNQTVTFNGFYVDNKFYPFDGHRYPCLDIQSINITCTENYDENHVAGESLNDIVSWVATSAMPYVQSGYTELYEWSTDPSTNSYTTQELLKEVSYTKPMSHKVDKKITDLQETDLMLNGGFDEETSEVSAEENAKERLAYLRFDSAPTTQASGDGEITKRFVITITAFTGKKTETFTCRCDVAF